MNHYQLDDFLTPEENLALTQSAISLESTFVPTTTTTNAENYRQSVVLFNLPSAANRLLHLILEAVPTVIDKLGLPAFNVTQTESQLTSHNDGHFYKIHDDNSSPDTDNRVLTYVYYFYNLPKGFSGGELQIHGDVPSIVEPRNNSIVFFNSSIMHEVLPISCPSREFKDSRFTVNGWLRK